MKLFPTMVYKFDTNIKITDNNFQIIYAPEKLVMHVTC